MQLWWPSFYTLLFHVLHFSCVRGTDDKSVMASSNHFAVFVYSSPTIDQFVFALNAVADNGDVYFHMSAPGGNAWMSVGFGDEMAGAFMLVLYPNTAGTNMTVSPRVALHGESEPTYYPHSTCETINIHDINQTANDAIQAGIMDRHGNMYADVVCHNATSWIATIGGDEYALDFTNKNQSFIWAVGPGASMRSDALDAPMRRHSYYGQFTMDMTAATTASGGTGIVPSPNGPNGTYVLQSASENTDGKEDHNNVEIIHAGCMCAAFLLIFPSGAVLLRLLQRVWLHTAVQGLGLFLSLVGFGAGVAMSQQYNRTRSYSSAHQILGLLVCFGLCAQFGLGLYSHMRFKRNTPILLLPRIHLVLGPLLLLVGLIVGGLGFPLALNMPFLKYYIILAIVFGLGFALIRVFVHFRGGYYERPKRVVHETEPAAAVDVDTGPGYAAYAQFSPDGGESHPLTNFSSPPGYSGPATRVPTEYGQMQDPLGNHEQHHRGRPPR